MVGLINWGDPIKGSSRSIEPEEIRTDILNYITEYKKSKSLISVNYNSELFSLIDEKREKNQSKEINQLKQMAKELKSDDLQKLAQRIENHDRKMQKEKADVEKKVEQVAERLTQTEKELETTHRQTLFLRNLANPKYENAVESLHMINTYAKSIKTNLDKVMKKIRCWEGTSEYDKITEKLFEIMKATQKICSTYNIVCHADYDIKNGKLEDNIVDFLREYIEDALFPRTGEILNIDIRSDRQIHILKFNPMEFGILIENIIYNSLKAKAHNVVINVTGTDEETIISFIDDGVGLNSNIIDVERIFELGYTTTNGSGVGLAHVQKIVEDMGGIVTIDTNVKSGFKVDVRIRR